MPEYVTPPSYANNYAALLSNLIGNLPGDYRDAQQQQTRIDVSNAFKDGVPKNSDGTINYAAALQMQAQAGDPGAVGQLGPLANTQAYQQQGQVPPPGMGGGAGGPPGAPPAAPMQLPSAPQQQAVAAPPQPSPGPPQQTLAAMVSSVAPDPAKRAQMTRLFSSLLKVDPNAPLTPDQVAQAQRYMVAAKLIPGAPGQLADPVRWDLMSGQGGGTTPQQGAGYYPDTQAGHAAFIKARATALGLDPNLPLGIANAEGLKALSPKNPNSASDVDRNPDGTPFSFGDFQLNVRNGLGNAARAKGIDPADPKQWQASDEFALEQMKTGGLGPWKGDAAVMAYQGGQGGGAPQQGGQPIFPQVPLPYGLSRGQEQQAIARLRQEAEGYAEIPEGRGMQAAAALNKRADDIAESINPRTLKQGEVLVDPYGRTLYAAPSLFQQRETTKESQADDIVDAIVKGEQPPTTAGLYGDAPIVRQKLAQRGFDLTKHMIEYQAAQKQVASLNGPQQVRFVGLANSVVNTIDEVNGLAEQMQLSGIPALNAVELGTYIQTQGNSDNGQLATKYVTAVGVLKEEFANVANGGYAPTEPAWKLANQQVNGNYGVKQLGSSLVEIQRLLKYRLNTMPGMNTIGPGAANPYLPGSGQGAGTQPPSSPGTPPQGATGGALAPGRYKWDPATGDVVPAP